MNIKKSEIPNPIKKGGFWYISIDSIEPLVNDEDKFLRTIEQSILGVVSRGMVITRSNKKYFRVSELNCVSRELSDSPKLKELLPLVREKIKEKEDSQRKREIMTTKDIIPMEDDGTVIPSKLYNFLKPKMSYEEWYKGLEERFPVEGMVTPEALKLPVAKSVVASTSIKLSKLLQKAHKNETKVIVEE